MEVAEDAGTLPLAEGIGILASVERCLSPDPVHFTLRLLGPSQLPQTIPTEARRGGLAPAYSSSASPGLRAGAALP